MVTDTSPGAIGRAVTPSPAKLIAVTAVDNDVVSSRISKALPSPASGKDDNPNSLAGINLLLELQTNH
jgi:hypothetical protein